MCPWTLQWLPIKQTAVHDPSAYSCVKLDKRLHKHPRASVRSSGYYSFVIDCHRGKIVDTQNISTYHISIDYWQFCTISDMASHQKPSLRPHLFVSTVKRQSRRISGFSRDSVGMGTSFPTVQVICVKSKSSAFDRSRGEISGTGSAKRTPVNFSDGETQSNRLSRQSSRSEDDTSIYNRTFESRRLYSLPKTEV